LALGVVVELFYPFLICRDGLRMLYLRPVDRQMMGRPTERIDPPFQFWFLRRVMMALPRFFWDGQEKRISFPSDGVSR